MYPPRSHAPLHRPRDTLSARDLEAQYAAQIRRNFYRSVEQEHNSRTAVAYRFENHSYRTRTRRENNWALEQYSQFPDGCWNVDLVESLKINCPDLCGAA